jgi:phage terminase large subunit
MSQSLKVKKRVFNEKYLPYLNCQTPVQIFYGGSSSGKSFFSAQRTVIDMCNTTRNFIVVRKVAATIKSSYFTEIKKAIEFFNLNDCFKINETTMEITGPNGNKIYFRGLDSVEKIKSIAAPVGVLTDLIVEEATEICENDYNQLCLRFRGKSNYVKRKTLIFNPIYKTHWICKRFFNGQNTKFLHNDDILITHSTYKDNLRFLAPDDIKTIESMEEISPYHFQVYALGEWGILGNLIFTKYRTDKLTINSIGSSLRAGLDFGFTNDPTACVLASIDMNKKEIYVFRESYKRGLTNEDIANEIKPYVNKLPVWCDCAEPKSIAELKQFGINACVPYGGKDSLLFSIQWLQKYTIIIDESCVNLKNELDTYQWQKDKDGNSVNQPIDINNHAIDALRYAFCNERKIVTAGRANIY